MFSRFVHNSTVTESQTGVHCISLYVSSLVNTGTCIFVPSLYRGRKGLVLYSEDGFKLQLALLLKILVVVHLLVSCAGLGYRFSMDHLLNHSSYPMRPMMLFSPFYS